MARRLDILFGENGVNALLNSNAFAPYRVTEPYFLDLNKVYTPKELVQLMLNGNTGGTADVDDLRHKSSFAINKMLPVKSTYPYGGFPMGQTRYAIYMDHLLRMGEELKANLEAAGAEPPGWSIDAIASYYVPVPQWIDPPREFPPEFDLGCELEDGAILIRRRRLSREPLAARCGDSRPLSALRLFESKDRRVTRSS